MRISITTNVEHELGNLQKCIAGGFERVVLISSDKKVLRAAETSSATVFGDQDRSRVHYFTPEEFLTFLDEQEAMNAGKEQRIRGYKVRTKYKAVNETEKRRGRRLLRRRF